MWLELRVKGQAGHRAACLHLTRARCEALFHLLDVEFLQISYGIHMFSWNS